MFSIYSKSAERLYPVRRLFDVAALVAFGVLCLLVFAPWQHQAILIATVGSPLLAVSCGPMLLVKWFHPIKGEYRENGSETAFSRWSFALFLPTFVLFSGVVMPVLALARM